MWYFKKIVNIVIHHTVFPLNNIHPKLTVDFISCTDEMWFLLRSSNCKQQLEVIQYLRIETKTKQNQISEATLTRFHLVLEHNLACCVFWSPMLQCKQTIIWWMHACIESKQGSPMYHRELWQLPAMHWQIPSLTKIEQISCLTSNYLKLI